MISDYLKGITPKFVRLHAKRRGRLLTAREIAAAGGICKDTVCKLACSDSWDDFTVRVVDGYLRGCGFDPSRTTRIRRDMRRGALVHLRRVKRSQKRMVAKILGVAGSRRPPMGFPSYQ